MIKKIIAIIFLGFFLIQCSGNDSSFIEKKVLDPFQSVSLENDERFGKIKLNCVESNLIATDQQTNRIHQLDYNTLNVVKSVGKEGRGPEEFNGIYFANSYGNNLYVSDSGNQGIHVLNENSLKYKSFIPERLSGTRFSVQPGSIYSAAPFADDNSILKMISLEDYESIHFGESNESIKGRRNYHHALANDSRLVAVSLTEPEFKIYELDGSLIQTISLEDEPLLTETINYMTQFYGDSGNSNSAVIMFQDATLIGDTLIVNVLNHKQESNSKTTTYNNYIVHKLDEDSLQKTAAFRTNIGGRGVTSSFCVNENLLYSTGGSNQLDIFVFNIAEFITVDN